MPHVTRHEIENLEDNPSGIPQVEMSWLPAKPEQLDEGPNAKEFAGRLYHVDSWNSMSDPQRVKFLTEMAQKYGNDPRMRFFTVNKILRPMGIQPRDYKGQAGAILKWVQDNIYYTNEPGEQIASPWWTLRERTGDCDDLAILGYALAFSIRLPVKMVIAGKDKRGKKVRWSFGQKAPPRSSRFFHIYLEFGWPPFKPTTWAAGEPTLRGAPLGYDVAVEGWAQGKAGGVLPELGAFGAADEVDEAQNEPTNNVDLDVAEEGILKLGTQSEAGFVTAVRKIRWETVLTGVITGIVTSTLIARRKGK